MENFGGVAVLPTAFTFNQKLCSPVQGERTVVRAEFYFCDGIVNLNEGTFKDSRFVTVCRSKRRLPNRIGVVRHVDYATSLFPGINAFDFPFEREFLVEFGTCLVVAVFGGLKGN